MSATVCFDLDGVLATGTKEEVYSDSAGWAYEKCEPITKMISILKELKTKGYKIIIFTARHPADYEKTVLWLSRQGIKYDDLYMGKPLADLYIDDNALRFNRDEFISTSVIEQYAGCSPQNRGYL